MKSSIPTLSFPGRNRRRWVKGVCLALAVLGPVCGAIAQRVLVPVPTIPEAAPQGVETVTTNVYNAEVGSLPPLAPTPPKQPFQLGPVALRPHVGYQFTYGNGILSGPGSEKTTIVNEISPGMRFDIGSRWTLDYTPVITLYSEKSFKDTLNHYIALDGSSSYYDWTFRLGQKVDLTSEPQVETATQTDRQDYTTTLQAAYQMNTAMSLEFELKQDIQDVSGFTNSVGSSADWSSLNWLNYHWGPTVSAAAGVGFGYEAVGVGADMTYEQIQGRVTWHVAQKINLSANGGVEIRQFLGSSAPTAVNPIMGLTAEYHPFEQTTLTLNAERDVTSSYFQDQVVENARISANLTQRLLKHLFLGISGSYTRTDYSSSISGASGRTDDYSVLGVNLSAAVFKRGLASVFYSTSHNASTQDGFSFTSQQVGFQLVYRY